LGSGKQQFAVAWLLGRAGLRLVNTLLQSCRFRDCFVAIGVTETIPGSDETNFRFGADIRKQVLVINHQPRGHAQGVRRRQMRTISFILACAFLLAGSSAAGRFDGDRAGIGTFSYNGSIVVAANWRPGLR
jgi:hypothetical protein